MSSMTSHCLLAVCYSTCTEADRHPMFTVMTLISITAPQCSEAANGPAGYHRSELLHLDTCTSMPMSRLHFDHSLIPGSVRVTVPST